MDVHTLNVRFCCRLLWFLPSLTVCMVGWSFSLWCRPDPDFQYIKRLRDIPNSSFSWRGWILLAQPLRRQAVQKESICYLPSRRWPASHMPYRTSTGTLCERFNLDIQKRRRDKPWIYPWWSSSIKLSSFFSTQGSNAYVLHFSEEPKQDKDELCCTY